MMKMSDDQYEILALRKEIEELEKTIDKRDEELEVTYNQISKERRRGDDFRDVLWGIHKNISALRRIEGEEPTADYGSSVGGP